MHGFVSFSFPSCYIQKEGTWDFLRWRWRTGQPCLITPSARGETGPLEPLLFFSTHFYLGRLSPRMTPCLFFCSYIPFIKIVFIYLSFILELAAGSGGWERLMVMGGPESGVFADTMVVVGFFFFCFLSFIAAFSRLIWRPPSFVLCAR